MQLSQKTMENCDKYVPQQIEDKWYEYWIENNFFQS